MRDKAWRGELLKTAWAAFASKAGAAKGVAFGVGQGVLFFAGLMAIGLCFFWMSQGLNVLGHMAAGGIMQRPPEIRALSIEPEQSKAWIGLMEEETSRGSAHLYPAARRAVNKIKAGDPSQSFFMSPMEKDLLEQALASRLADTRAQIQAEDQEAALNWARLIRSGASLEEAARKLRQESREHSRQKELQSMLSALNAPRLRAWVGGSCSCRWCREIVEAATKLSRPSAQKRSSRRF